MIKSFEEFQSFGKDGWEAYAASATAMTKGFQTIASEVADFSRQNLEKSAKTAEKMMGAKSFDSAVEMQQDYAKDAYETFMSGMTKIGELYTQTAKEAYKPIEDTMSQFAPVAKKASAK